MKTEPMTIQGEGYTLAISPEAEQLKASMLSIAAPIQSVTTDAEAADASAAIKNLASFRNALEKSRKAFKLPILEAGRVIDAKAAEFGEQVTSEESRIKKLVEAYAAEQYRKQQEAAAEARRQAEEARRKAEQEERARLEAQRAAEAAERARAAAEQANSPEAIAAAKRAEEERQQAEFDAEMAKVEAEAATQEAIATMAAPVAELPKAKAQVDFEVTDIRQFADAYPQLVTIAPKRAEILAMLKLLPEGSEPSIPGIVVTRVFKAATR